MWDRVVNYIKRRLRRVSWGGWLPGVANINISAGVIEMSCAALWHTGLRDIHINAANTRNTSLFSHPRPLSNSIVTPLRYDAIPSRITLYPFASRQLVHPPLRTVSFASSRLVSSRLRQISSAASSTFLSSSHLLLQQLQLLTFLLFFYFVVVCL